MSRRDLLFLVLLLALAPRQCAAAPVPAIDWYRQLATPASDAGSGVSVDGMGNVYVSGTTRGNLEGNSAGQSDAFLSKYNAAGDLLWTRQFGTSESDSGHGVATDLLGNAVVVGETRGDLDSVNSGVSDAWVRKYDALGTLRWALQFGTTSADQAFDVSTDPLGNVYVSGSTQASVDFPYPHDAWLRKYDASGNLTWTQELVTADTDVATGVSVDRFGSAYVAGFTTGALGGTDAQGHDAFLAKYAADGNLLWIRQYHAPMSEFVQDVSADSLGNIYVTGSTQRGLSGMTMGSYDAFLLKYDAVGNLLWTRQPGTTGYDQGLAVATDGLGNVYLTGSTMGSFDGTNAGSEDVFVLKYDAFGNLHWSRQLGAAGDDSGNAAAADELGNLYVAGLFDGAGRSSTAGDVFLARFYKIPEPATIQLALACSALFIIGRKSH